METRATAAMLLTVAAVAAVGSSAGAAMAKDEPMGAAGVWAGTPIPLGQDAATLASSGIAPTAVATTAIETMPVPVGGGSGVDFPTLDASTAGGLFVGGGLAVAGLLLIGAEITARRNRMRSVQLMRSHESTVG